MPIIWTGEPMNAKDRGVMIVYLQRIEQMAQRFSRHNQAFQALGTEARADMAYIEQYAAAVRQRVEMED